jgi:hypothetical protein
MNTENFHSFRSALPWTTSLVASFAIAAGAAAQSAAPSVPNAPPPPEAMAPASGAPYYSETPVSAESIGTQRERFQGTQAPILDGMSVYNRPGMSPTQYGIAVGLQVLAATHSPQGILGANSIADSFRTAPFESRAAYTVYAERINVASNSLDSLQAKAVQFGGDTASLHSDEQAVRDRRTELDRNLIAAENANRDNWDQARQALADSYRQYADAVAHASADASR